VLDAPPAEAVKWVAAGLAEVVTEAGVTEAEGLAVVATAAGAMVEEVTVAAAKAEVLVAMAEVTEAGAKGAETETRLRQDACRAARGLPRRKGMSGWAPWRALWRCCQPSWTVRLETFAARYFAPDWTRC
jgi:hypothetical protein